MLFPYGEWIILSLALAAWAERHPSRRLLFALSVSWLIGYVAEAFFNMAFPWHWHYSRLAVMLVFWRYAWKRAHRRYFPVFLILLALSVEDLFRVNEPGVLAYEEWIYAAIIMVVAWISTQSYWEMAAAIAGGFLFNQLLVVFFFSGIVSYLELPESFFWHFFAAVLAFGALVREWRSRTFATLSLGPESSKVEVDSQTEKASLADGKQL